MPNLVTTTDTSPAVRQGRRVAKPGQLLVATLLDESSSMRDIMSQTTFGVNQFILKLRAEMLDARATLLKFNDARGRAKHEDFLYKASPLHKVPAMGVENYRPGGSTPLIDAAMDLIEHTAASIIPGDSVLCVLQTDGHENCSHRFTTHDLRAEVLRRRAEGWVFIFLGAGVDGYLQSERYGIDAENTLSYAKDKSLECFDALAARAISFANTGDPAQASFDKDDRKMVGDTLYLQHHVSEPEEPKDAPDVIQL